MKSKDEILSNVMMDYGIVGFAFMKVTLKLCDLGYAITPDNESRKLFDNIRGVWSDKKKATLAIGQWERSVMKFYKVAKVPVPVPVPVPAPEEQKIEMKQERLF